MKSEDDRLAKRYWLLQNMDFLLREKEYHLFLKNKEAIDFHNPKVILWNYNDAAGRVEFDAIAG